MEPSIGRIVHYVLQNGEHRPGIIVRTFPSFGADRRGDVAMSNTVNLQVFLDNQNDRSANGILSVEADHGVMWRTSVMRDDDFGVGTWHWPEMKREKA